ncbi:MAG: thymidine phosphorylase [Burkholderiaceae bacterium]
MQAAEIIRIKRDAGALSAAQMDAFVAGLNDGSWSEGQIAALAMAIVLRGMSRAECVALTRSMTQSGEVLNWDAAGFDGPILDKHSTGGVGDKVSLILAPMVAACGGVVPMISGRGLGHTGGTLDKLESLAGYTVQPSRAQLLKVLRSAGCAIVGASARVAPADKRLYAIRDVTATVESVPLITASILSKKLAAGLQGLVIDVKMGNGAFCPDLKSARTLASSLTQVARSAGLRTEAAITDMNQVLGTTAGNAVEVRESLDFLTGVARNARLTEVTLELGARMLKLGGLARTHAQARSRLTKALDSGAAAEKFARMVAGLNGPRDVFAKSLRLPQAPVQRVLAAPRTGVVAAMDTRAIGAAIVALGGGRSKPGDKVDPRVGISQVLPVGTRVQRGDPLLHVHAATPAAAEQALAALARAVQVGARARATPVILKD